jgi:hypothetical protein
MANVTTPKFRVSYPNVFKAKLNDMNGKEEYSLVALFAKGADLSSMKKAAQDAIVAKWGADQKKWPKNLRSPFRSHDEKATEDDVTGKKMYPHGMEEGGVFVNLKSQQKPGLVDQNVQDIISEADFYAGCFARATVRAYAYDAKGNCGVAFGLQNIQKMGEGDSLGSRTRATDDFAPIEGAQAGASDASSLFA